MEENVSVFFFAQEHICRKKSEGSEDEKNMIRNQLHPENTIAIQDDKYLDLDKKRQILGS